MTANSRDELLGMAERVEGATGPDRETDLAIALAVGWYPPGVDPRLYQDSRTNALYLQRTPLFTSSLDAAMTLVPEGWHVMTLCEGPNIEPRPRDFTYDGTWSVELHATIKGLRHNLEYGSGATPALALTAASLRAHASIKGSGE
jgi:hypothetical protein